jgi:transposase
LIIRVVDQDSEEGQQPPWIVPDELWARIESLSPVVVPRRSARPGRPRLDDRKALCGILFVLTHRDFVGIPAPGVRFWVGYDLLAAASRLERGWCLVTPARESAGRVERRGPTGLVEGGGRRLAPAGDERRPKTGPSQVDRARPGSKHHLITEGHGIPLAAILTGGNRNDMTQLMPLIEAVPPVRGRRGRPRRRPDTVFADRGYDHDKYRKQVQAVGITPVIARRGTGPRLRAGQIPLGRRADIRAVTLVPPG